MDHFYSILGLIDRLGCWMDFNACQSQRFDLPTSNFLVLVSRYLETTHVVYKSQKEKPSA